MIRVKQYKGESIIVKALNNFNAFYVFRFTSGNKDIEEIKITCDKRQGIINSSQKLLYQEYEAIFKTLSDKDAYMYVESKLKD